MLLVVTVITMFIALVSLGNASIANLENTLNNNAFIQPNISWKWL